MSYAQNRATARILGTPPHHNVDGNADGNRIPPYHAASRQTSLKSGVLRRIPPYHASSIGLRIRRSQVRVLPSALRKCLHFRALSFHIVSFTTPRTAVISHSPRTSLLYLPSSPDRARRNKHVQEGLLEKAGSVSHDRYQPRKEQYSYQQH